MNKHPLKDLSERYIKERTFAPSTIKSYRNAFKYFISFLERHEILSAKAKDVIHYRAYLRELGHSAYYIHVHISALRGLYLYLKLNQKRLGLALDYAHNIMDLISSEKIKPTLKKEF